MQESDGAEVISVGLPGFENGLDGEVASTNFKFVDWAEIANSFTPPLVVTPAAFDPRK